MSRSILLALVCASAGGVWLGWVVGASAQSFTIMGTPTNPPTEITPGPDGALWFTEGSQIGRITTRGSLTEFPIPAPDDVATKGIATGPDGALWFTESLGPVTQLVTINIGRITVTGAISEFPLNIQCIQNEVGCLGDITTGPDGNLWFTLPRSEQIGQLTPALPQTFTKFNIPSTIAGVPGGITTGPDGALWFTYQSPSFTSAVGRITTEGKITALPGTDASAVAVGPDGALWLAADFDIGRMTTAGSFTQFAIPGIDLFATSITPGPDGNLWFTETGANKIGRITPAGTISEFATRKLQGEQPQYITSGPDGALWFTSLHYVWRLTTSGTINITFRNTDGNIAAWFMTASLSGGAQVQSGVPIGFVDTNWQIVGQRDFNGDGKADLVWSNANGEVAIWIMNGSAVASSQNFGIIGNGWSIVGTGDFNGDGVGDLLWRNTNGEIAIWLLTWEGTVEAGTVQVLSVTVLGTAPTSYSVAQTGDFNGDGMADILWHNQNGDTAIWYMAANGTLMQVSSVTDFGLIPPSWSIAGTGDFNGDGSSDILWRNTNGDLATWLMTGVTVLSPIDFGIIPTDWSVAVTGDYNGDGTADIVWRNANGDLAIWCMTPNGTGVQVRSAVNFGIVPTSWLVQGAGTD